MSTAEQIATIEPNAASRVFHFETTELERYVILQALDQHEGKDTEEMILILEAHQALTPNKTWTEIRKEAQKAAVTPDKDGCGWAEENMVSVDIPKKTGRQLAELIRAILNKGKTEGKLGLHLVSAMQKLEKAVGVSENNLIRE